VGNHPMSKEKEKGSGASLIEVYFKLKGGKKKETTKIILGGKSKTLSFWEIVSTRLKEPGKGRHLTKKGSSHTSREKKRNTPREKGGNQK